MGEDKVWDSKCKMREPILGTEVKQTGVDRQEEARDIFTLLSI